MEIRLKLLDPNGGAPLYCLGDWTTSGINLTKMEGNTGISEARLPMYSENGGAIAYIAVNIHDDGTIELGSASPAAPANGKIRLETPSQDNALQAWVSVAVGGTVTITGVTESGSGAPAYDSAVTLTGTTFSVTFSEKVVSSDFALGVTVNVNAAPVVVASAVKQAAGNVVIYTIPAFAKGDVITWAYDANTGDIADQTDGTVLATVTAKTVTNSLHTLYASSEIGTVAATTVVVTFADNVVAAGDDYTTGVTIKVNTVAAVIASGIRQANHKVVRYVIPAVDADDVVTWEYSKTTGIITSVDTGALMDTITAKTVTNNVAGVPPTLASAEVGAVNATTLVATFSVNVKAAGDDYSTGMTVKVGGAGVAISAGVRQADHKVIRYTIPAVVNGNVVTIEYAHPTGIIQNEADSAFVATFAAAPVTNNVA
jgi:hypothetical protein